MSVGIATRHAMWPTHASAALDMPVEVGLRETWEKAFTPFGFSKADQSCACTTGTVVGDEAAWLDDPDRGPTTLTDRHRGLERRSH